MKRTDRLVALLAVFVLAGCSNAGTFTPSGSAHGTTAPTRSHLHPAEGADALPGEGADALPGSQLQCTFSPTPGQASCTIAINVNVPPTSSATTPSSLVPGLHPADLLSLYSMPSSNSGQTVAIVDAYDDPSAEADLAVYRNTFGLSACTSLNGCFRKVNQSGAASSYPAANAGW